MGVVDALLRWIGATPQETPEDVLRQTVERAEEIEQIASETREDAERALQRSDDGMSFDELAEAVAKRREERNGESNR